jgi:hypothetical protein
MAISARNRWLILGSLLTATLVAMVWVEEQAGEETISVAEPRKSQAGEKTAQAKASRLNLDKLQRSRDEEEQIQDVFKAKSWYVPPPPPKPEPPPPPAPPPLPFKYMGKLLDDGKLTVFVTKQDRNYAVKAGDTIEGAYRVESVEAQRVLFTYLPLNMQQTLVIGGVN